jgi:uncharacterized protein (DUF488 family)
MDVPAPTRHLLSMSVRRPLFTLGHSNRSFDDLLDVLRSHGIAVLVDIRTIPRSRANPQFNGDVLGPALAEAGIRYVPLRSLGGLRGKTRRDGPSPNDGWELESFRNYADYAQTPAFREGLRQLIAIASREPTAIMCAEMLWWRCHRRIVTDHLLARGVPVVHLFTSKHAEDAALTPFAVADADGEVRYPAPSRQS